MTLLNTFLLLAVALAVPGVINRIRARLAGRRGIRFLQHLYDLRLHLRKGAVYSSTTTALFRTAPSVYLGAALVAALTIPVGDLEPLLSFEGDLVCIAYTLALGRFALILAAMDTGSAFEGMGASREALYGALVEPALMLAGGTLALMTGCTSLARIFDPAAMPGAQFVIVLLLTAYVLVKIVFTESGRVPVDDPRTHLELTMIHEVMCLDY
ncbi:MAG: NADH-quinone oxidoreductase subunit H, partial [Alistipes sp.]|nr:NADH-quinone oxidoreductase subunit H [Alistipes sp.]